ncbi:hypothetical protein Aduo_015250 [Ancylostoma duodenale]
MVPPLSQSAVGPRNRAVPSLRDGRSPLTPSSQAEGTGSEKSIHVGSVGIAETDDETRLMPRMSAVIAPPHVGAAMTRHVADPGTTGKTATVRTPRRHHWHDHHGSRTGGAAEPVRLSGTV